MFAALDVKKIRKISHQQVINGKFAMTETLYEKITSCFKTSVIKDLKGIPQKAKMQVLKETAKRIEQLRKQLICKATINFREDGKPLADQKLKVLLTDESEDDEEEM